ncbi:hypothetical protein ACHAXA_002749 [Cyclostephanos tholiformis]|uniref:Uncharacterized protein n=1 Tax=Cyclostephanos tholiformis TaxID=382380 RepID=A0ABD3RTG2_9STRA
MKISPRITRQPLIRPNTPSYLRTNSVLIQTDSGRKFDASIRYNRVFEDPYTRSANSALKLFLIIIAAIALLTSFILFPERLGFSSLPMAVSDRKYFGMRSINNGSISSIEDEENEVIDSATSTDDNIDAFRGAGDDDTRDILPDAFYVGGENIDIGRNDTAEIVSETLLIENSSNGTTANNTTNGTLKSIMQEYGRSGDDTQHSDIREEHKNASNRSEDEY